MPGDHNAANATAAAALALRAGVTPDTIARGLASFPGRRLVGVFQPHLFTRTRDFLDGFATALSKLDHAVLLPIYPARELPLPGVDAQAVGEKMVGCPVECPAESRFLDVLETCDPDVLLFMGAGDLDQWIPRAIERLSAFRPPQETPQKP